MDGANKATQKEVEAREDHSLHQKDSGRVACSSNYSTSGKKSSRKEKEREVERKEGENEVNLPDLTIVPKEK